MLREVTGVQGVVAFGWPPTPGGASGIVAFVHSESIDLDVVRRMLKLRLPKYMIPSDIQLIAEITSDDKRQNRSGSFDSKLSTFCYGQQVFLS